MRAYFPKISQIRLQFNDFRDFVPKTEQGINREIPFFPILISAQLVIRHAQYKTKKYQILPSHAWLMAVSIQGFAPEGRAQVQCSVKRTGSVRLPSRTSPVVSETT